MKKQLLIGIIVAQIWMIGVVAYGAPIRFRVRTVDPDRHKVQSSQPVEASRDGGLFAVQFDGVIQAEWRSQVEALGAVVVGYVPENALVVRLGDGQLAKLSQMPFIRWCGHVSADLKVEPETLGHQAKYINVVVKLVAAGCAEQVVAHLQENGATGISIPTDSTTLLTATVPSSALLNIADSDDVQWIEEWIQPHTTNNVASQITQVAPTRERLGLYGAGQVVGLADSGLDSGDPANIHSDFADRVIKGYAFRRPSDWSDPLGHGTHVAGIIAASGAQSGSQPSNHDYAGSFAGMAPEANIVIQSIGDATGDVFPPMNLENLFSPVYEDGVRTHNDSWGSPANGRYTVYAQQVDQFVWSHKDFVVVFPVGNDGVDRSPADGVTDPGSLYTPSTAKNCIAVGATESDRTTGRIGTYGGFWPGDFPRTPISNDFISNNPNGMVAWSGRGPCADGRIKPDICVPGVNIISTRSQASATIGWQVYDSNYLYWGGTSMAAPHVTGAAAIVREYCIKNKSIAPSAALVKAMLMNAATDLFPGQYGDANSSYKEIRNRRPDISEGWGRLDLSNALDPAAPRVVEIVDETSGINTSEERVYQYTVLDNSLPLSATLAWTDYPGELLASQELVNDLDLTVIAPNGITKYYGNGTSRDSLNNVETVDIAAPMAGTYTVKVKGYNVPFGPQPFALVVSAKLPGTYIAGRVLTATGKPIAGATVTVSDGNAFRSVTTDGNGAYTIHVSPSSYTVSAGKPGWAFLPTSKQVAITDHGLSNINFKGSAPAGGISGTVKKAVGGMTNYVLESPHPYNDDADIIYTIQAHPSTNQIRIHFADVYVEESYDYVILSTPDENQVQYISGGYSDYWSDWFDGNTVQVRLISNSWNNDWGFYIDGYETDVVLEGGVDGVMLRANPYNISTTSQNAGLYSLPGIEPVSYNLSASKPNWDFRPATTSVSVPPSPAGNPQITLPGIDFLACPPASFSGQVMTGDVNSFGDSTSSEHPYYDDYTEYYWVSHTGSEPCSRMRVHFSCIDTEQDFDFVHVATSSGEIVNSYSGSYPDGVWSDWIDGDQLLIMITSDYGYGTDNTYWGFEIDEYMIAGNERPLSGVQVQLESGQSATTDQDGNYLIEGIKAGSYLSVTATKPYFSIDPPVRYANSVSGMVCAGGNFFATTQTLPSLGLAKSRSDAEPVAIEGLVVTAGAPRYNDFFYVESTNRASGIRVAKEQHGLQAGEKVNISGTLSTLQSGERAIIDPVISPAGIGSLSPLGITGSRLGGGDWQFNPLTGAGQIGVSGSCGLNNIGLLVTIWGRVSSESAISPGYFYVDDGAGGVQVDGSGLDIPDAGDYISVTGISSCAVADEKTVSVLLPRSQDDIIVRSFGTGMTRP